MANKKITDLTLRSDFDATCNLPVDDTSQTWRATGAQIRDFIHATAAIAVQVALTSNFTPTVNGVVKYDTILSDTTGGAYDTATGLFTAPETAYYRVSVSGFTSSSTPTLNAYINGTIDRRLTTLAPSAAIHSGSQTYFLTAGQTLGIFSDTSTPFGGTPGGNDFLNSLSIEKVR
jgi:hypothetical protein